jgi:hypothetical protein
MCAVRFKEALISVWNPNALPVITVLSKDFVFNIMVWPLDILVPTTA